MSTTDKITCDDCGSIQSSANVRCELCAESLQEERARRKFGSVLLVGLGAVFMTALLMVGPGFVLKAWKFASVGDQTFWSAYVSIFIVGGAIAERLDPGEGLQPSDYGPHLQGPTYYRTLLRLAVLPMGLVFSLWRSFLRGLLP